MTAGLQWDESTYHYTDSRNDIAQIFQQSDPIRFILGKPILTQPGTQFFYNGGLTNLLGEIVHRASAMRTDAFADEYLFSPLGITDRQWQMLPNDVLYTSGDLKLRPRDMAKLGYLYLNQGVWKSQQIISKSWVEASTHPFIRTDPQREGGTYGYQWWLNTIEVNGIQIESFSARGWGGQNIIVMPALRMIIVTTAGYYDDHSDFHLEVLLQIILSALM
jgi:CubicO group peptidase (beta-lactamase class C family)